MLYWPTSIAINGFLNNIVIDAASSRDADGAFIKAASIGITYTRDICSDSTYTGANTCSGDVWIGDTDAFVTGACIKGVNTNKAYIRGACFEDTSTKSVCIGCASIIDAGDACACASCTCTEGASVEDDYVEDICIGDTGAIKRLRMYLQSSQILEL